MKVDNTAMEYSMPSLEEISTCTVDIDHELSDGGNEESTDSQTDGPEFANKQESIRSKAAKFLLRLREGHKVSQVALMEVISTFNEMWGQACKSLKDTIKERLTQAKVDPQIVEDIPVSCPFDGVDTIYLFEKFCVENFNCIVSYVVHVTYL